MPLAENCKEYIGRSLLVLPYYGFGWNRSDLGEPCPEPLGMLGPEPLHVQLEELISCGDQLVGASGIIKQPKHQFDDQWCGFYLRSTDQSDFTTHPGDYMIWIARERLSVHPASEKALYEWVDIVKSSPVLCGYGTVAESVQWIAEIYERTTKSRRLFG